MTLREAAKAAADEKAARDEEGRQRNIDQGRDRLRSLITQDKVLAALLPPSTEWDEVALPESHVGQIFNALYYRQAFFITSEDGVRIRLIFNSEGRSGWREEKQVLVGHHEDGGECWVSFGNLNDLHKKLEAGVPEPKAPEPQMVIPPNHYQQANEFLERAENDHAPGGLIEFYIHKAQVHATLAVAEAMEGH